MRLSWVREAPARWDEDKARILGATPGAFDTAALAAAGLLPGEWWRADEDGVTVGYGWMDVVWGDGQILLAVDPSRRGQGVGSFVLDRLEEEAARRGLHHVFNAVRPGHSDGDRVTGWLAKRGFGRVSGEAILRRPVAGADDAAG